MTDKDYQIKYGVGIKKLRVEKRKWTEQQLANAIEVNARTIKRIEAGENDFKISLHRKFSKVFGMQEDDLLKIVRES